MVAQYTHFEKWLLPCCWALDETECLAHGGLVTLHPIFLFSVGSTLTQCRTRWEGSNEPRLSSGNGTYKDIWPGSHDMLALHEKVAAISWGEASSSCYHLKQAASSVGSLTPSASSTCPGLVHLVHWPSQYLIASPSLACLFFSISCTGTGAGVVVLLCGQKSRAFS